VIACETHCIGRDWPHVTFVAIVWFGSTCLNTERCANIANFPPFDPRAGTGGVVVRGEYGPRLLTTELVMAPQELDFAQTDRRANRIYAGTCIYLNRKDPPAVMPRLLPNRPLLYCGLGSFLARYAHAARLFSAIVEAFREDTEWQVVINVGQMPRTDVGTLPPHVQIAAPVPHLDLLRCARVFVSHGGLGSVQEAIHCGVPLMVFPCSVDQPGNAARVVHHRVGVRGDIATVTPAKIRMLLNQIVHDPRTTAGLAAMQQAFRAQETCMAGTAAVEEFLAAVKRSRVPAHGAVSGAPAVSERG
jgi:zeaxanthin glucosyltransferase